ncbi:DEAD-domain-containing protein [Atractiella rhizophila]|nr:DEAD-domain-containing protein [Atractiella rhizophila]
MRRMRMKKELERIVGLKRMRDLVTAAAMAWVERRRSRRKTVAAAAALLKQTKMSRRMMTMRRWRAQTSIPTPLLYLNRWKMTKRLKGPNPAKYFSSQISKSSEAPAKTNAADQATFQKLGLSRTLLVALKAAGLEVPTLIQQEVIPVAMTRSDIVGSSQTGSGKTAAFVIPILERLLHRPRHPPQTRTLILAPTRELAVQIHGVVESLGRFTDVKSVLCVGGLSLSVQAAALKQKPEVVVSTPGRLIDHMRNSAGFEIEEIEILVIDEADRMMEEGFKDELEEIVKSCPRNRQTMLFSATISEDVSELARLSLQKPVRIKIDHTAYMSRKLAQEFIRVRAPRGDDASAALTRSREAILLALCLKDPTFPSGRTLIFFRSKAQAHRMKIIFSLLRYKTKRLQKAEELHGDLTQDQRLKSLKDFKDGKCGYLLCTDLASRGLDIKGVENVINFEVPKVWEVYLHRVGRTARAGREGRAVTLVGESDRKLVKAAIKNSSSESVKHRTVPIATLKELSSQLAALEDEIASVLVDEKEEKELRRAEMELKKGENLIIHQEEIASRPARTWFQSKKEKAESKGAGKRTHNIAFDGPSAAKDLKKEKEKKYLTHKERRKKEALDELKADKVKGKGKGVGASIKAAKKAQRPEKVGMLGSHGGVDLRALKKAEKGKGKKKEGKERGEMGNSTKKMDIARSGKGAERKKGNMAKSLKADSRKGAGKNKSKGRR